MSDERDRLVAFAARTLAGPCSAIDRSWSHGQALVLEVRAADGSAAIAKLHRTDVKYRAERDAYREVVHRLGDRAPRLLDSDDALGALLLSRLAGEPADTSERSIPEEDLYRQAGELLRRLHGEPLLNPMPNWSRTVRERLERWIERAPAGLLTAGEVRAARARGARGPRPAAGARARPLGLGAAQLACRRRSRARDRFEHLRPDAWVADLQRVWWGERDAPHRREWLLEGYGRSLTPADEIRFVALSALGHLTAIVWGEFVGDPQYRDRGRDNLGALAGDHLGRS